jgi:hypothetical protein
MDPSLRRFLGDVLPVTILDVWGLSRPLVAATGEMNPVQGMSGRPNPV